MKASSSAKLCLLLFLTATSARAQAQTTSPSPDAPNGDAIKSILTEAISVASSRLFVVQEQTAQVSRDGADYRVRLPLTGFITPADPAVNAVARPTDAGMWNIASMTVPSAGSFGTTTPDTAVRQTEYSIGEQSIHALIDPKFIRPSSLTANLAALKIRSMHFDNHSEDVIDRYVTDSTWSVDTGGLLDLTSNAKATNWHQIENLRTGSNLDSLVRTVSGHFTVEGLDRAKGQQLMDAGEELIADRQTMLPNQPPGLSPPQRHDLRTMVDAVSGMLTRFQGEWTLDGTSFVAGITNSGTIGRVRVEMAEDTRDQQLNANLDIGMDDLAMTSLSPEMASYVPRHIAIKSIVAGVPTAKLMALLWTATEEDADPATVDTQLTALLSEAGARIGIGSLTFDSGPLQVTASARIVPRIDGTFGADIHVAATGADMLIARAQGNPAMQRLLPALLTAKGMGRPAGDALVWDIALGGGPITVNGVPIPLAPLRIGKSQHHD
ncbi:hypothetical protein [Acidisphaera sp. S103]|uniref:hypothetical protein n=1 Tax=Acidisphaera sp. S103 TaxID=1747223 RepID=UPI00131AEBDC|nr:hypothetical protein [Acidisphaera sp. S103]